MKCETEDHFLMNSIILLQCIPKAVFKGMAKCVQAVAHGLDHTYSNFGLGGMASVFQLMEIVHTHYWTKELIDASGVGSASIMSSQSASPMGSRENLHSPTAEGSEWSGSSRKSSIQVSDSNSRRLSEHDPSHHDQSTTEIFKDMLTQKRNMLMSKLTSFDSDSNVHGSHVSVASDSMNVPKTGGQLIPSISCRSTVSDSEYENVSTRTGLNCGKKAD